MVKRFKRKSRYLRGWRTHSWGKVGQHRRSGSSGGRGKSGRHKHKWTWVLAYKPDYFGKHGFTRPLPTRRIWKSINVGKLNEIIDELVEKGIARVEDGKYIINLLEIGFNKLLGEGKVTKPMIIKTIRVSRKAEAKVKAVGGEIQIIKSSSLR